MRPPGLPDVDVLLLPVLRRSSAREAVVDVEGIQVPSSFRVASGIVEICSGARCRCGDETCLFAVQILQLQPCRCAVQILQ
jgi:hypothetical protein